MGIPPLQMFHQEGPLDQAAKALQFKQMMGANQMQQQQLQEGDIALQQKQQDMKDQQTIRQLFIKNQGDMDRTLNDAISAGVKPQTVQAIKASQLELKNKLATLDENTLKATKARTELYGQVTGSILALPPEQRKQAAMNALPDLVQKGVVKPEEAQQLQQQLPQMDDIGLEQFLKLHQYSAMATDKQLDEVRKAKEEAATLPGKIAESKMKVEEAAVPLQQRKMLGNVDAQAGLDWLKQNPGKNWSDFLVWKNKHSPTMMMAGNLQLTPQGLQVAAQNYGQTGQLPGGLSRAPQVTAAVINKAGEEGANIPENKISFAQRKALETEYFGRGKTFQNIRQLNTAAGHFGRLYDAVDALNNGNISKLNELGNSFNVNVRGMSAPAAFNAIKTAAVSELASMFKGSAATDPEIAAIAQTINSSLAGEVNKDVIKEDLHLLGSRLYSIDEQYRQANGGVPAPKGKILFRNSENILKRVGVQLAEYQDPNTNPQRPAQNAAPAQGGGSGMAVSLSAARNLPRNKGKTDQQIKDDIIAHGHKVID